VGKPGCQKDFLVYRDVLCHFSEYFRALLSGGFKENGANTLTLDEVDVDVFELFFYWLNTGHVEYNLVVASSASMIVRAYVLADFYLVQCFKNRVLDLFCLSMITQ
jgi:hypothetical protein